MSRFVLPVAVLLQLSANAHARGAKEESWSARPKTTVADMVLELARPMERAARGRVKDGRDGEEAEASASVKAPAGADARMLFAIFALHAFTDEAALDAAAVVFPDGRLRWFALGQHAPGSFAPTDPAKVAALEAAAPPALKALRDLAASAQARCDFPVLRVAEVEKLLSARAVTEIFSNAGAMAGPPEGLGAAAACAAFPKRDWRLGSVAVIVAVRGSNGWAELTRELTPANRRLALGPVTLSQHEKLSPEKRDPEQAKAAPPSDCGDEAACATKWQQECEAGAAEACAKLGIAYVEAAGVAPDDVKAAALARKACDGGAARGCRLLGGMYAVGRGVPADKMRARALLKQACDAKEAVGCRNLAMMYEVAHGGAAKDDREATRLYEVACDASDGVACRNLAARLTEGRGIVADAARAARLLEKACAAGEAGSCRQVAAVHASGSGVTRDETRAATFKRKACDLGDVGACAGTGPREMAIYRRACDAGDSPRSCVSLGWVKTRGAFRDDADALALFRRACTRGSATGCYYLAWMIDAGRAGPRDERQAFQLTERACSAGNAMACNELGAKHQLGSGVRIDLSKAATFYARACELYSGTGCRNLAVLHGRGAGVPADHNRAAALFQKGCKLDGVPMSCVCAAAAEDQERRNCYDAFAELMKTNLDHAKQASPPLD